MQKIRTCILLLLTIASITVPAKAGNTIHVKVNAQNGDYTITSSQPDCSFGGSIHQRLHDLQMTEGRDAIGQYKMIRFEWKDSIDYTASIRWYLQTPVVIFGLMLPKGSQHHSPAAFPAFTNVPEDLPYHFSFHNHIFPLPQYFLEETSTPWMLFNRNADACIISPASDFIVSLMTNKDSTQICSGLNPEVKELPTGFIHSTILVLDNGIRKTWDTWGNALQALYNKKRPSNDHGVLLKYFGYWTDNGADYYYNYDTAKGYAATLLAVRDYYKQEEIPIGYMQLDSWWYEKSRYSVLGKLGAEKKKPALPGGGWNRSGGLMKYEADPVLFPNGLAAFQKKLGLPLITHNRWIDYNSPYRKEYKISGISAIDTSFWKHIMLYLKSSGVAVYEQDWMNYMYLKNPAMIADVRIGNEFTDGMAKAARENGIDIQYCMALPRYFMQGIKYDNLTTIRVSGDGFSPKRWKDFIFTSQLAYEMGIWPWCDVFKSSETGNMIVSVLSAGAVGTGDAIGKENKNNIMMACRNDGVLVKPDVPLLPFDKDYVQMANKEQAPVLAYTYTKHANITTGYVFAFANEDTTSNQFSFSPADIGLKGNVVIFNPVDKTVTRLNASKTFNGVLPFDKYAYYIVAPVTASGIAFLGDAEKIAATGKKRIAKISNVGNSLQIKVLFAKGEKAITLRGYAQHSVTADKGNMNMDNATHLFTLSLPAPQTDNSIVVNLKEN